MEQLNPPIIMFVITLVATAMFIVPTLYKMPSRLVNFYWTGFWMFLGLIAFTAGTSVALSMAGVQVDPLSLAGSASRA